MLKTALASSNRLCSRLSRHLPNSSQQSLGIYGSGLIRGFSSQGPLSFSAIERPKRWADKTSPTKEASAYKDDKPLSKAKQTQHRGVSENKQSYQPILNNWLGHLRKHHRAAFNWESKTLKVAHIVSSPKLFVFHKLHVACFVALLFGNDFYREYNLLNSYLLKEFLTGDTSLAAIKVLRQTIMDHSEQMARKASNSLENSDWDWKDDEEPKTQDQSESVSESARISQLPFSNKNFMDQRDSLVVGLLQDFFEVTRTGNIHLSDFLYAINCLKQIESPSLLARPDYQELCFLIETRISEDIISTFLKNKKQQNGENSRISVGDLVKFTEFAISNLTRTSSSQRATSVGSSLLLRLQPLLEDYQPKLNPGTIWRLCALYTDILETHGHSVELVVCLRNIAETVLLPRLLLEVQAAFDLCVPLASADFVREAYFRNALSAAKKDGFSAEDASRYRVVMLDAGLYRKVMEVLCLVRFPHKEITTKLEDICCRISFNPTAQTLKKSLVRIPRETKSVKHDLEILQTLHSLSTTGNGELYLQPALGFLTSKLSSLNMQDKANAFKMGLIILMNKLYTSLEASTSFTLMPFDHLDFQLLTKEFTADTMLQKFEVVCASLNGEMVMLGAILDSILNSPQVPQASSDAEEEILWATKRDFLTTLRIYSHFCKSSITAETSSKIDEIVQSLNEEISQKFATQHPTTNSNEAEQIAEALLSNGMRQFESQKQYFACKADFYLPQEKIFIEIDGRVHFQEMSYLQTWKTLLRNLSYVSDGDHQVLVLNSGCMKYFNEHERVISSHKSSKPTGSTKSDVISVAVEHLTKNPNIRIMRVDRVQKTAEH